ncbi:hypothetical protein MNEG_8873 [Monoraphidium neglectum]|uniref:Uncharacterized protein n=1 Tax=Monoraphidium neglectum TaxID=145388 RepID=A0A0D2M6T0_9CHLO|nr:hypothetical protein MNEG_8873 [Monoraphidium neglectum]KIY99089.1 hypothetical protein MNEG_8873 [Monoraphidium neglectum]|eukprot:XP_013898109.1 hypothetical protein MNEG_8873 [Monoraphidium neglectum]
MTTAPAAPAASTTPQQAATPAPLPSAAQRAVPGPAPLTRTALPLYTSSAPAAAAAAANGTAARRRRRRRQRRQASPSPSPAFLARPQQLQQLQPVGYSTAKERAEVVSAGSLQLPQRVQAASPTPTLPQAQQQAVFERLSSMLGGQVRGQAGAGAGSSSGDEHAQARAEGGDLGRRRRHRRLSARTLKQAPAGRGPPPDLAQLLLALTAPPVTTASQQQAVPPPINIAQPRPPGDAGGGAALSTGGAVAAGARNAAVVNVVRAEHGVVNPVNDVTVLNPRGQPQGQILQQQLTSIENDALSVGIDVARGGVVGEITSPVMPPPLTGRNLVNVWDCGRLVQQSYYGCSDGSCWASKPWRWNPGTV